MIAVILWLITGIDHLRQERQATVYARNHDLLIKGLVHDPADAVTLIATDPLIASAVLCAIEPADAAYDVLGDIRLICCRPNRQRVAESALIRRALANTRDPQLVSQVLGVPLVDVQRLMHSSLPGRTPA